MSTGNSEMLYNTTGTYTTGTYTTGTYTTFSIICLTEQNECVIV